MNTTKQNISHKLISGNPQLLISKELLSQISYLHNKIGGVEWSGLIFYKILSGEINDPDNLKLRAERLYLMDIGNATYTEFSPDETIIDFYDKYPECESMKWGMIHTHHGMDTFFSGTDMQELLDNSGPHQFYLSLIVNYKDGGKFTAKLGIMSEVEIEYKYGFRDGISLFKKNPVTTEKQLLTIDCNIVYEQDDFDTSRYEAIKEAKSKILVKKQEFQFREYPASGKQLPINFLSPSKYIPKTKSEIESYLGKLISLNMHNEDKLSEVLENVDKHIKANPEMADAVYYDLIEESIENTYTYVFNDYLMVEHHNAFFKQCILVMDNFRMRGYSFYDKIIDIFDMYIDLAHDEEPDFESEPITNKNKKKSVKKHVFNYSESKMEKLIKQADKALSKNKKYGSRVN